MALERGLGRGLGALLGTPPSSPRRGCSPPSPSPRWNRGSSSLESGLTRKAFRIWPTPSASTGSIQPLTVRRLSSGYYQFIAGERRWRAAKLAGLNEIPAVIIEADDRKVMELGLIENLQREDWNPIEEANGYKVLMSEYGLTQEEVAQRVGKSRPAVANALRLLALPDPVHLLLEEGKLSAGHARAILAVPSGELQKKLAQKVIAEELSVRQTEALAKRLAAEPREAAEPKSAAGPDLSIYLREAEKTWATRFGRKVHIINGRKREKSSWNTTIQRI